MELISCGRFVTVELDSLDLTREEEAAILWKGEAGMGIADVLEDRFFQWLAEAVEQWRTLPNRLKVERLNRDEPSGDEAA
jgi:hypothetical protein